MEREWKLGEDLYPEDNILDGITFDDLILAVHQCRVVNRATVHAELNQILSQELICKGLFLPPNTYDCGSFVVN